MYILIIRSTASLMQYDVAAREQAAAERRVRPSDAHVLINMRGQGRGRPRPAAVQSVFRLFLVVA